MVSGDLWTNTNSKSREVFLMIPEKAFAGLSIRTVEDLLELLPVRGIYFFSIFSLKKID